MIEVTAGNAEIGVAELLLDEVHGKPLLSEFSRVCVPQAVRFLMHE